MSTLPYTFIESPSEDAFVGTAVAALRDAIETAIDERGECVIGLSGGSTPRPVFEALGKETDIEWNRVWMFLVDERHISDESPESNLCMIRETLLHDAGVYEAEHVVAPKTDLDIDECVLTYDRDLRRLFDEHGHADIVTLGLGDDGHIASLFPPLSDLAYGPSLAAHTVTERFAVRDRITVTVPVLQNAAKSLLLLKGEKKRKTLDAMTASTEDEKRWPLKTLFPGGNLTVLLHP